MSVKTSIQRVLCSLLFLVAALSSGGCVYLVVGSIGAVGGYVVSPDTVQGTVSRDYEDVWEATESVVNIMGRIVKQNDKEGRLEAIVSNVRVNVDIVQYSSSVSRLTVKARKSFFPSIATAQDVYVKIVNELNK